MRAIEKRRIEQLFKGMVVLGAVLLVIGIALYSLWALFGLMPFPVGEGRLPFSQYFSIVFAAFGIILVAFGFLITIPRCPKCNTRMESKRGGLTGREGERAYVCPKCGYAEPSDTSPWDDALFYGGHGYG